ncbi:trimeric intracellular cation channel family protein [Staphylospora marina]|uniref:trimeric intracellular cation channel family protein n=1 Tax=Staphylospora marina TaxID=2490858 RepID=UPI000F5BFBAA|nr:trimeric intracellular cation channel family protein [Staphylospora marina]
MELSWELLNFFGIAAFAVSGALVAIKERYDLFGVYVLGLVTAFGGGIIRNVLIGLPPSMLWNQKWLIYTALIAVTVVCIFPRVWMGTGKKWLNFFDAIGLAAFSIQGALHAVNKNLPLVAVVFAAVMTGIGGGIVRDVLAGRKPLVFRKEIYALWSGLIGLVIGLGWADSGTGMVIVFILAVVLRMISFLYDWRIPGTLCPGRFRDIGS